MTIPDFQTWLDTNINTNGVRSITGAKLNTAVSGLLAYIRAEKRTEAAVEITSSASNVITFKNRNGVADPFPADTVYALPNPRCYDASGNNIDFRIFDLTVDGFKITPVIDAYLDYEAVEISQTIPE